MPAAGVEPAPCCQEQILIFPVASDHNRRKVVLEDGTSRRKSQSRQGKTPKIVENPCGKIICACFDFSEIDLRMRLKSEVDWRSKQAKSDVTNINQIRIICHRHNNEFGGYYDKKRLRKEVQIVPRRGNAQ
jgi:hypothetical protein